MAQDRQYRNWQANSVTTLIHLLPRTPVILTDISLRCILSEVSLKLTLDQNSEALFRIPGFSVSKPNIGIEAAYKPRVTPSESLPGLPVIIVSYSSDIYNYSLVGFKPLNAELNPICCLLALLGAHHFLYVSRIRVKLLTLR